MNRRAFLASLTAAPLAAKRPAVNELRVKQEAEDETIIRTIVTAHTSAEAAEAYRRGWADSPYETEGEWYVQSSEQKPLPKVLQAMPGSMMFFECLEGEGAEETIYPLTAFRRDFITVVSQIRGYDEELMIGVGNHVLDQEMPTKLAAAWNTASLQRFLPPESLIGPHTTEGTDLWP